MVVLLVIGTIIFFVCIDLIIQFYQKKTPKIQTQAVVKADEFCVPGGYFFSPKHLWVKILSSGKIRIGIDDFIQKLVGRIDKININSSNEIKKGEPIFSIIQDKKIIEFPSPVTGKIININPIILDSADVIKQDTYNKGWAIELEPENISADIKRMFIANETVKWLKDEIHKFKKFVVDHASSILSANSNLQIQSATIQDGGYIIKGALEFLDSESWKEFNKLFINENQ